MKGIELIEINESLPKKDDGEKFILCCDFGSAAAFKMMNEAIQKVHRESSLVGDFIGSVILHTHDGCFTIKNGDRRDKEIELVPIDEKIIEPFVAANNKAKMGSILSVLDEKPRFNGRRSKGDRIRDRKEWRAKWRK